MYYIHKKLVEIHVTIGQPIRMCHGVMHAWMKVTGQSTPNETVLTQEVSNIIGSKSQVLLLFWSKHYGKATKEFGFRNTVCQTPKFCNAYRKTPKDQ